ncbi:unnamed protein product [Symbiodinium natans]|uniref:Uncharacterized protein n=1 Tax=Symbiodinium natans TaxID=878477 RepID=A0A812T6G7_9DINO|nr:unnamed protein product [Symbiodinium natans]
MLATRAMPCSSWAGRSSSSALVRRFFSGSTSTSQSCCELRFVKRPFEIDCCAWHLFRDVQGRQTTLLLIDGVGF